jgi:hypothetical protein
MVGRNLKWHGFKNPRQQEGVNSTIGGINEDFESKAGAGQRANHLQSLFTFLSKE